MSTEQQKVKTQQRIYDAVHGAVTECARAHPEMLVKNAQSSIAKRASGNLVPMFVESERLRECENRQTAEQITRAREATSRADKAEAELEVVLKEVDTLRKQVERLKDRADVQDRT